MRTAKFQFGNVVVVDDDNIGVIVKTWQGGDDYFTYDVYVRYYGLIREYKEVGIKHYVFSKCLSEDEYGFYN